MGGSWGCFLWVFAPHAPLPPPAFSPKPVGVHKPTLVLRLFSSLLSSSHSVPLPISTPHLPADTYPPPASLIFAVLFNFFLFSLWSLGISVRLI